MRRTPILSLFIVLLAAVGAHGQSLTGTLLGRVADPSGAAIPRAEVRVVNLGTNEERSTLSDATGDYTLPALEVGTWSLTASFDGFQTLTHDSVVIQVGDTLRVDLALTLVGDAQSVQVEATRSVIRTDDSSIGIVIDERMIRAFPNNGRLFEQTVQIVGGVSTAAEGSELANRGGFNSVGMDENSNSNFLDGFDNNDPVIRNIGHRPALDMIEEFRVEQNGYPAEYGRNAGTIINVVTKRGTNGWHGTISNYLRNDNLDARNYFAPAQLPDPNLVRNQFSGTLGGALVEDRTFAFGSYEGVREKRGDVRRATVPTLDMRDGDFGELLPFIQLMDPNSGLMDPYTNNVIPQADWDLIGESVLLDYPLPNSPGTGVLGLSGNRVEIANHIQDVDSFSIRVDHDLIENTQVTGRYSFSDGRTTDPFRTETPGSGSVLLDGFGQSNDITRTNAGIGVTTFLGGSTIHEFRAGFNRVRQEQLPLRDLPANQEPIADVIQSYLAFSPISASTIGSGNQFSRVANVFNYIDQITWISGAHQLKAGVDLRKYQFNGGSSPPNQFIFAGFGTGTPNPQAPFGIAPGYGVADLLLGIPIQTVRYEGNPEGHSRKTEFAAYFQDDWRVTPDLTLNLGLRWEWYGRITEINDRQSTWDPVANDILVAGVDTSRQLIDDDWNNFAPRFGFAYRPLGAESTVVRGAAGIYYDSEQRQNFFQIANPPFFTTSIYEGLGLTLDAPFPMTPGPMAYQYPISPNAIEKDYRDTYFEHWNLSLQQLVARDTVVEIAYIGNHGVKLQRYRDVNDYIIGVEMPPYPGWGPIRYFEQAASSIYHSLQIRFQRRFFDDLGFLAVHTWGHSIDDRPAQSLGSIRSFQNHQDPGADRSDSDFDARHRFTLSMMYDVPALPVSGTLSEVLNGWSVNGVLRMQSGRPLTVYLPNLEIRPDGVPGEDWRPEDQGPDNWLNPDAFANPMGFFGTLGRNTARGPGLQLLDLAAVKNFLMGEDNTLEFRAEFFNLLNHPNFSLPNPEFGSASFGTIGSTSTPAREMQFGLRYEF